MWKIIRVFPLVISLLFCFVFFCLFFCFALSYVFSWLCFVWCLRKLFPEVSFPSSLPLLFNKQANCLWEHRKYNKKGDQTPYMKQRILLYLFFSHLSFNLYRFMSVVIVPVIIEIFSLRISPMFHPPCHVRYLKRISD